MVFNARVLKFHKIVGLFLFIVLATQWVLSIQKLYPSVLGFFFPLFFGNFPPFIFYRDMKRISGCQEPKGREMGVNAYWFGGFLLGNENVLELDNGDGCTRW